MGRLEIIVSEGLKAGIMSEMEAMAIIAAIEGAPVEEAIAYTHGEFVKVFGTYAIDTIKGLRRGRGYYAKV